ncbi:MAG TPA: DUF805 domain-containing protein [Caulobacteraceae bacterium]|jgi:uncharacterized membrane protein YhaH (DUF805 family)|nr:DUF805 domain-containing protein [Caulobacteraceae bacterium]
MGAFGELFGFDGRITRLGFLWRLIVSVVGVSVLTGAGVAALIFLIGPQSLYGAPDSWMRWLIIGLALLSLWISVALASRRLRDMGLEPVYIIPLYAALWVVDTVLLQPLSLLQPQTYGALEDGWSALQLLTLIPLLFWPSRAKAEPPRPVYEPAQPTAYLNWRDGG